MDGVSDLYISKYVRRTHRDTQGVGGGGNDRDSEDSQVLFLMQGDGFSISTHLLALDVLGPPSNPLLIQVKHLFLSNC